MSAVVYAALDEVKQKLKEREKQTRLARIIPNPEDRERLRLHVLDWYETCHKFRTKVANEGFDYYYDSYTEVPVRKEVYAKFYYSLACVCGKCEETKVP